MSFVGEGVRENPFNFGMFFLQNLETRPSFTTQKTRKMEKWIEAVNGFAKLNPGAINVGWKPVSLRRFSGPGPGSRRPSNPLWVKVPYMPPLRLKGQPDLLLATMRLSQFHTDWQSDELSFAYVASCPKCSCLTSGRVQI